MIVFVVLALGFLITSFWLFRTEHGLRFTTKQAEQWLSDKTNQQLSLSKIEGNLWQGFRVESLRWQQGEKSVEADQLEVQLDWTQLHRSHVLIKKLTASAIHMNFPAQDEPDKPFTLPERIDLPVNLDLRELALKQVFFNRLAFNNIRGTASVKNNQFDVSQLSMSTEGIELDAKLNIALYKPYPLHALLAAKRTFEGVLLDAKLQAQGSLERLELNLNAQGRKSESDETSQNVQAHAVVTFFRPAMFEAMTFLANDFNPAQWINRAPSALLFMSAKVQPSDDFSQSIGEVQVQNMQPMPLYAGGIPVSNFKARFELALENQQVQQLDLWIDQLEFADKKRSAGSATANMQWRNRPNLKGQPAHFNRMKGDMDFNIYTQNLDASVFAKLHQRLALNASLQGSKKGEQLTVNRFSIRDRKASLNGQAQLGLGGTKPLDLQMALNNINPRDYMPGSSPQMQGNLNGNLYFKGDLIARGGNAIHPFGALRLNLANSTLANAPLTLNVQATGGANRLSNLLIDLKVLGNTALAQGSYGTQADVVELDIHLSELNRLGRLLNLKLGGSARLQGKLRGIQGEFSGQGHLDIRQFTLDETLQIEQITGQFQLGSAPTSTWVGDIDIGKIKTAGKLNNAINAMKLTLRGTRSQHELKGVFSSGLQPFSRQRPLKGEFVFSGGVKTLQQVKKQTGWQGALTEFKLDGMWLPARSLSLQKPAPLTLAVGHVELLDLLIQGEDASLLQNEVLRISNREIQIVGGMPRFSIPRLSPILRKQLTVEPKDLVAKVNWNYWAKADKVTGHVDVSHVSGGLQVLEDSQVDVDIRTLLARVDFNREAMSLNVNIHADQFGAVNANLSVPVEQNPLTHVWGIAGNKPMVGSVAASFTKLNWLGPILSGGVRTSGTGQVAMAIGGTANKPDVQGRFFAMDLDVFQLDQGVRLEDGNVVVDFTTDKATIDTFEFIVYNRQPPRRYLEQLGPLIQGSGKITARGQWNLSGNDGEIHLKLDQVPLVQRPDRWAKVNSTVLIQQPRVLGEALKIRGELQVLGAYFEMLDSGPQKLGADVFIQGRTQASGPGLPIDLQVQANLGDNFYVNAEGLNARLQGDLRLVMLEGVGGSGQRRAGRRLMATGTINTVGGTYRAYGQDLTIDRGVVNFQGPLENPGLNVRAVRKGVAVEAGVEITGTAQRPTVTLVSEPAVPDPEKLSWMILGRGSGSADRDATLLLTAAAAIFGDDEESTTRKIAKSIGIDDLSLSTGSLTAADSRAVGSQIAVAPGADFSASIIGADDPLLSQRIVSLGKRISKKVYLSFDQSVTTAASILKLNYQHSRQLSFIARTGADNAVDVLYQFSFD